MTATPLAPAWITDAAFDTLMPPIAIIGVCVRFAALRTSGSPCAVPLRCVAEANTVPSMTYAAPYWLDSAADSGVCAEYPNIVYRFEPRFLISGILGFSDSGKWSPSTGSSSSRIV